MNVQDAGSGAAVGQEIRRRREALELSQEQLGVAAKLSSATVRRVEAGRGSTTASLEALAAALDCTVRDLFMGPSSTKAAS